MNENAEKWVAALRSGEYKQTKGRLRRECDGDYAYCCLGVASDLYARETGLGEWSGRYFSSSSGCSWSWVSATYLLLNVQRWLGLRSHAGEFAPRDTEEDFNGPPSLAGLNDTGKTFIEIADVIESEPEGLFE